MNLMKLQREIEKLVAKAGFSLGDDVTRLLKKAYRNETNEKAKKALAWILENAKIAGKEKLAICQDTGLPIVFIEAGKEVKISSSLIGRIKKGIEAGYRKNYFRESLVHPLKRGKPSYSGMFYHIDFSANQKGLKITVFPKGFGSENKSRLKMFNPTASLEEIEEFIVESVKKAGPEACPPFIVGVGIGGASDTVLLLAKKALLERVDKGNPDKFLNNLERKWLKKINSLKIGPMGLGGKNTCLAVKIKMHFTHIAGLPVGVNISCHALRRAAIQILDP